MRAVSTFVGIAGAGAVNLTCSPPLHPSNPAAIDRICDALCTRRHGCDERDDYGSCVNTCRNFGSPRRIYYRPDVIDATRTCIARTACGPDLYRRLWGACFRDVFAAIPPTPLAQTYCENRTQKDVICGVTTTTVAKCLEGNKLYSDPILQQLNDCLGEASCRTYGRCLLGVVGPDEYWDSDRDRQWRERPLMTAPPTTVRFSGTVLVDGTIPSAGASICVDGRADIACVSTDAAGRYDVVLPASQELAITVNAAGSVPQLVPIRTGTADMGRWMLATQRVETLKARFASIDADDPGPQTTSVAVYARTAGGTAGFERIEFTLAPATGTGPFYFESDGAPSRSRRSTSVRGSALFANVAPGTVQLNVAPAGVTCVPGSAGWAAPQVNQVRAPVRPGHETRVTLSCHW
jgi:hypothetical protein